VNLDTPAPAAAIEQFRGMDFVDEVYALDLPILTEIEG